MNKPIAEFKTDWVPVKELKTYPKHVRDQFQEKEAVPGYYELPEYEWVEWRQHGPYYDQPKSKNYIKWTIGGSDVGKLYSEADFPVSLKEAYPEAHGSRFQCLKAFWAEKTGVSDDFPMAPKKEYKKSTFLNGHIEEESCRQMFKVLYREDYPMDTIEVVNDTYFYQCGDTKENGSLRYPYIVCNIDGTVTINGEKGGLECKTCLYTSPDFNLWKNEIVPLTYFLQVQWYMKATALPYFYIIVKLGIGQYKYFKVERNEDVINILLNAADYFIDCCEKKVEPEEAVSKENAKLLYEYYIRKFGTTIDSNGEPEELPDSSIDGIYELLNVQTMLDKKKAEVKELETQRDELIVKNVFDVAKDANADFFYVEDEDQTIELHFRKKPSAQSLDTKKIEADDPALYQSYLVKQKDKFNSTAFKKEHPELVAEYTEKKSITDTYTSGCNIKVEPKKKVDEKTA